MKKTNLIGDIYGGAIAGVVALPLALAFGIQSGMGAEAGLYGAIAIGLVAAIFGGTPTQVSGPTGPMTVFAALTVLTVVKEYGSIANGLGAIISIFFLAGCFQIIFGLCKIGHYIKYIPHPVISGFMTGIGVIIILFQIFPFLGHTSPTTTIGVLSELHKPLAAVNYEAVALGCITLAIIYLFKRWNKYVPSTLVALLGATVIAKLFNFDVVTIGKLPAGFNFQDVSALLSFKPEHITFVIMSALTFAGLGSIDSLLTSVVADRLTRTRHNSNRELIGQGLGNMVVALIGGIPGAGATMRTVANIKAGGKTRLSGVIHSLFLLCVLFGLGQYVAKVPIVVLDAILIDVGFNIIDFESFKILRHLPGTDRVIMLAVLLLTVFTNLLQAVAAGMILVAVFFMEKLYEQSSEKTKIGTLNEFMEELSEHEVHLEREFISKSVYVKAIHGPLFWGLSENFCETLNTNPDIKSVALYMGGLSFLDQSGYVALQDAFTMLKEYDIDVFMIELQEQPEKMLRNTKFIPKFMNPDHLFQSYEDVVDYLSDKTPKTAELKSE